MNAPGTVRFGDFGLNRSRGCLEDATGVERFLRPKSYRVLEILCERRGQLVSKDDLVQEAWPDVFVSDDSLAHCVSDIRRALGAEGAALLRTVPRRGYLLLAEDATAAKPGMKRRVGQTASLAAILVLAVAGAWWTYPWATPEFQPEVIGAAMMQTDTLLETRDWRRRQDNEAAREMLEAIVANDPANAEAWASLGLTYWLEVQHLAWGGGQREFARALEMVERAVALGDSARAHRLLAEMRLLAPFPEMRMPVDALANARAAVTMAPDDPDNLAVLAHVFALTGRTKEAVETIEQALRLNPTPPDWHRQIAGLSFLLAGEPARAIEELGPLHGAGTFASARSWPGWLFAASLAHAGRMEEAELVVRTARVRRPEQSIAAVEQSFDGFADRDGLAVILDGLRLSGLPG